MTVPRGDWRRETGDRRQQPEDKRQDPGDRQMRQSLKCIMTRYILPDKRPWALNFTFRVLRRSSPSGGQEYLLRARGYAQHRLPASPFWSSGSYERVCDR
ncbi:GL19506 [Drosophila persimilis]|uniref:GL19506 n=1 Tax=Drosophila persimilis TaxID=7234 RepID=B4G9M2_DROPE|nr:GL19506 [Drosophila persimilis]